jgi:hypothetical protein
MKNGLIAIYLSDSYFKGKLTRIGCEGHTNNTGDNGAGKTTSLNLIPVFYGLAPDKLIQKAGSKKSFIDFYLPRYQSMVVFEYIRAGQTCCVILYRKTDKSFAYRLAKGAADAYLFNEKSKEKLKECKEAKVWLKDYISTETLVSKQIDTTLDYRAIIQNDIKRLKVQRAKGASLSTDAYDFSLCSPESYMQHIESLTSVLMKHERLLEQFKTMVVDSFLVEQLDIGSIPFNKKDRVLINDLRSLIELNKHNDKFSRSINEYNNLKEVWGRLTSYKSQLNSLLVTCHDEIDDKSKNKISLEHDLTVKGDFYERTRDALNESLSVKNIELKINKEHLDSLYLKREGWDEEDISQKEAELGQLEDYRNQWITASEHYDNLLGSVKKEKYDHEISKLKVNEKAAKKVQVANENIRRIELELHSNEKASTEKTITLEKKKIDEQELYKKSIEDQQLGLQEKLVEAKVLAKIAKNLTDEETIVLSSHQEKLDSMETNIEHLELESKSLQYSFKIKRDDRSLALISYDRKNKILDTLQSKIEAISKQRYPVRGSLKEFLNSSGLAWRENIGKIIRPELLLNTKLSPELYAEVDLNNIFGISVNLDNVLSQDAALSDQILSEQLENLKLDVSLADDEVQLIETHLKEINAEIKKSEVQIQELNRKENHVKEEKKRLRFFINSQKETFKSNGLERFKVAETERSRVNEHINQLNHAIQSNLDDISYKYHQLVIAEKERFSFEEEKTTQSKVVIEENIFNVNQTLKKQCQDLDKLFESLLSDLNIDTKMEAEAKAQNEKCSKNLERVESYRELVNKYNIWEKIEWSRLGDFNNKNKNITAEVTALEQKIESNYNNFDNVKTILKQNIKKTTVQINNLKKSEETAQGCLNNINTQLELAPIDVQPSKVELAEAPILLFESVNDSVTEAVNLKRSIIKVIKNVVSFLGQTNNRTKINELWFQLHNSRIEASKYEPHEEEFFLESIKDIETLIETSIPDITSITIESIRTVGEQIIRFYQSLDSLKKKVSSVSTTLANNINTQHEFPAIGNIEISLVSKISEYDIWKDLKNFNSSWTTWQELEKGKLPTNDFLNAFASVIDSLGVSKITSDIASLVDINISLEENGRLVNIRNDNDLKHVSSTGISMLAVIVVFCGMTRYLCRDESVKIHWPLDELGKLSTQNTTLLFKFMDKHNIALFCAQPNPPSVLRKYFTTKNHLVKDEGVYRYTDWKSNKANPLLKTNEQSTKINKVAS